MSHILPLTTAADLVQEGEEMGRCVAISYGHSFVVIDLRELSFRETLSGDLSFFGEWLFRGLVGVALSWLIWKVAELSSK